MGVWLEGDSESAKGGGLGLVLAVLGVAGAEQGW